MTELGGNGDGGGHRGRGRGDGRGGGRGRWQGRGDDDLLSHDYGDRRWACRGDDRLWADRGIDRGSCQGGGRGDDDQWSQAYGETRIVGRERGEGWRPTSTCFLCTCNHCHARSIKPVSCWMVTGERQAARIRNMYLTAILRQEVGYFDKETNTGEVIGRMSGDTVLIQDAMGEKVSKFIQLFSTFIGGFVIAFVQGWLLTLVMMSTLPPLILASALMATIMSKMASKGQTSYAEASIVVEQTIGSIRTVASFTGEKRAIKKYGKSLRSAYKANIIEGTAIGVGFGAVMFLMFCGYALGVWYGAKLILDKGYTGGKIINVIFAILTASFSLGQASPSVSAFAAGQAAAYKMFETINRKPEIDAYDPSGKTLDDIRGDIELRDVYFTYPTRPDEQIFCGFSIIINSGLSVALFLDHNISLHIS